jgi:hypothetical protein
MLRKAKKTAAITGSKIVRASLPGRWACLAMV